MNEKKRKFLSVVFVICLAILVSILLGFINDNFQGKGLRSYNKIALSIIHDHNFHGADTLSPSFFRRPPGYPIVLALAYLIFGESHFAVVMLNIVLWISSILLLWKISARFLDGLYALMPPLLLSVWWGVATYVFTTNSDLFALFLTILFVWNFYVYQGRRSIYWLVAEGFVLAFLILTKPIVLYTVPFLIIWFFYIGKPFTKRETISGIVALSAVFFLVGAWSLYSYEAFGTFQLSSNGLTLLRRADDVLLSSERVQAFFISSVAGDYITDRWYPGYAADPEPITKASVVREKQYQSLLLPDRSNDADVQTLVYNEARALIKQSPIKFFSMGIIYVLRLNMPVNQKGIDISHLFVGTYPRLSEVQKISILVSIFLFWYVFVGIVFTALIWKLKKWKEWGIIIFFVVYFNVMYALATHSEARYLLPVMPFYFLLFIVFLTSFLNKRKTS